jgi:hypothetical protein
MALALSSTSELVGQTPSLGWPKRSTKTDEPFSRAMLQTLVPWFALEFVCTATSLPEGSLVS